MQKLNITVKGDTFNDILHGLKMCRLSLRKGFLARADQHQSISGADASYSYTLQRVETGNSQETTHNPQSTNP